MRIISNESNLLKFVRGPSGSQRAKLGCQKAKMRKGHHSNQKVKWIRGHSSWRKAKKLKEHSGS